MPMPRLLQKLSSKNLRRRTLSTFSASHRPPDVPPVPGPSTSVHSRDSSIPTSLSSFASPDPQTVFPPSSDDPDFERSPSGGHLRVAYVEGPTEEIGRAGTSADAETRRDEEEIAGALPLPGFESLFVSEWRGFLYSARSTSELPVGGVMTFMLRPAPSPDDGVQAFIATEGDSHTITGTCSSSTHAVSFRRSLPDRHATQFFAGKWDPANDTLLGTLGFEPDPATHFMDLVFRPLVARHARLMPPDKDPRALWKFATAAVLDDVRQRGWTWSYFKERRDTRRKYIELFIRNGDGSAQFGATLSEEESDEYRHVKKALSTGDLRFYSTLAEQQIRTVPRPRRSRPRLRPAHSHRGMDHEFHGLGRLPEKEEKQEKDPTVEERVGVLERRFSELEDQISGHRDWVNERLLGLERMLQELIQSRV
ncbi:unnamed protein product [Mycena citricolor]|uniref:Uncharacterized protein n=1 Tax=Mycena citricolor TaxID=2018698 RepID=A0AAD2HNM7_9AGAR|nr:unnamed protein product [Mycena citricolor]